MAPLRRHQLVHLTAGGWNEILDRPWEANAREVLVQWAKRLLPLVVTRQPEQLAAGHVALGLAAPLAWQRRRLAVQVPRSSFAWIDEFPAAQEALRLVSRRSRARWLPLFDALAGRGTPARVYGSHGWQLVTGHDYLHAGSDLDLWIGVDGECQADAVVERLGAFNAPPAPRLDGELLFPDGSAVAWREWAMWRASRTRDVLVKRLHGATLEQRPWVDHAYARLAA